MNSGEQERCCEQRRYEVYLSDLPISCPTKAMTHWDGHPRVYLDVKAKGEVSCPYCSTVYVLRDE